MSVFKLAIIDTGLGNLKSIAQSIKRLPEVKSFISNDTEKVASADAIILPGVGAFDEFMRRLKALNLVDILNEKVIHKKTPVLGICVGMQAFFEQSSEGGGAKGLGWMEGKVEKINKSAEIAIPQIGWNSVNFLHPRDPIWHEIPSPTDFYFLHSYVANCPPQLVIAECEYGQTITAVVQKEHVIGVQFHPERSHKQGEKLISNFITEAKAKNHAKT
jgi:glutamine amidotransferase